MAYLKSVMEHIVETEECPAVQRVAEMQLKAALDVLCMGDDDQDTKGRLCLVMGAYMAVKQQRSLLE